MKMRNVLALLFVFALSACKAPPPPAPTDDTLVTSEVNGVTLTHRYAVKAPTEFTPINENYRALYPASLMSQPDYGGKLVRQLENGKTYVVLGQVEHFWMALAEEGQEELIGYVPMRAVVKSALYEETVRKQTPRLKPRQKQTCVNVDGSSKACKNKTSGTWILD
ncbi:SH3 domain-containing protein [Phytobacter sp. V91]|uniref:SH3 domain-containing protein n=1 Tax=Phytobacter sp. V91 TaxID=3369425 RepID=UPI003F5E3871